MVAMQASIGWFAVELHAAHETITPRSLVDPDGMSEGTPDAPAVGFASVTYIPGGVQEPASTSSGTIRRAPITHVTTDANGRASLSIVAGSSVSSFVESGSHHYISTVLGVQPGDELVFGSHQAVIPAQHTPAFTTGFDAGVTLIRDGGRFGMQSHSA